MKNILEDATDIDGGMGASESRKETPDTDRSRMRYRTDAADIVASTDPDRYTVLLPKDSEFGANNETPIPPPSKVLPWIRNRQLGLFHLIEPPCCEDAVSKLLRNPKNLSCLA